MTSESEDNGDDRKVLESVNKLKRKRAAAQGSITRVKRIIDSKGEKLNIHELNTRLELLESSFTTAMETHLEIEDLDDDAAQNATKLAELEDLYCGTKAAILGYLNRSRPSKDVSNTTGTFLTPRSRSKNLPRLKLPLFNGEPTSYLEFWNKFKSLVDNDDELEDFEKFQHLISCLGEKVRKIIEHLEATPENYTRAKTLLDKRFNNPALILTGHVRQLFDLPAVNSTAASQLRQLSDSVMAHIQSMSSLAKPEQIYHGLLLHLALQKVDSETRLKWDEIRDLKRFPEWDEFSEFLNNRCQILEARAMDGSNHQNESASAPRPSRSNAKNRTVLISARSSCIICSATDHYIQKCPQFTAKSPVERYWEVKRLSLCINCLTKGHTTKNCTRLKCRICAGAHHTLLHRDQSKQVENVNSDVKVVPSEHDVSTSHANNSSLIISSSSSSEFYVSCDNEINHVILATAVIYIKDKVGSFVPCRALLDSASQLNIITESLSNRLQIKKQKVSESISGIGAVSAVAKFRTNTTIKSRVNNFETSLEMIILPTIVGPQPHCSYSIDNWNIPKNLPLADPHFYESQGIDVLIGASVFFYLLCVGQIKLQETEPTLQKTLLGWIVSGCCKNMKYRNSNVLCSLKAVTEDSEQSVLQLLEKFWVLESTEMDNRKWSLEQQDCEDHFRQTYRRTTDGRFIVKYPIKDDLSKLGSSYDIALRRFLNLERKLRKDRELNEQYSAFMKEYEDLNHMELIDTEDRNRVRYWIPHHCVLRPESSTTKLRVVFDCSCHTSANISLNEMMMGGPTIQAELSDILIRFRFHKYALTADISKMYRQIIIDDDDKYTQCIIWRNHSSEEIRHYKLNTVTYGTAAAPFLATRCLQELSNLYGKDYPAGATTIRRDFYMDDLITGADSIEELSKIKSEVKYILSKAKFDLRKWCANDEYLLKGDPVEDLAMSCSFEKSNSIKTLGIVWQPVPDLFSCCYKHNIDGRKITKRTVLSDAAKIYDPLGIINPVTVIAKIFLQDLWKLKINWDESLPTSYHQHWETFKGQLSLIQNIKFPRLVLADPEKTTLELHGFADASSKAYGCCIYVRCIASSGAISVKLLCAKSRVAPVKSITIPRLELCGALLLAELMDRVQKIINRPIQDVFCWTDSTIVLAWLADHPSSWNTFVAHRVANIEALSSNMRWKHVPTTSNPADIVSRGMLPESLVDSTLWFNGPDFLMKSFDKWPIRKQSTANFPKSRRVKIVLAATIGDRQDLTSNVKFINDYQKLRRVFGFILRFVNNSRRTEDRKIGPLSAEELDTSLHRIIWIVQNQEFAKEIRLLESQLKSSLRSSIANLNPFLDSNSKIKLLRVGGRLQNADITYESKHPILLPKSHPFVLSLVKHYHEQNFHAGPQALVAAIRHKYWIVNARSFARQVVHQCYRCFRSRPQVSHQLMGNLPASRLKPTRPFLVSGVDFCGPICVHQKGRGNRSYKVYIAVFVCFAVKAVHLEVVSDLTSQAFIAALKRFIARRGHCRHLYCDNGTNFVGAKREMRELHQRFNSQQTQDSIIQLCADDGIEFHHIPPRAPHFGGLWEAAVKMAKTHLYRTFGLASLTYEELSTAVTQIEAILNSRPLTPLSSDPNDLNPLTPAHFLIGEPLNSPAEPDVTNVNISRLSRWQQLSWLQQQFWLRWSKEYLLQLQQRGKWHTETKNIQLGRLVVVVDSSLPPQRWLLGRIIELHPGADGLVRVVSLKTKLGTLRRPIAKVCPLPSSDLEN